VRVTGGGEVLAPGRPERQVQVIDVRDLAEWTLRMAAGRSTGVFNAVGPALPTTMGEMLDACRAGARSDARFTWVDEAFLLEQGVAPWSDLPLWLPETNAESAGMLSVDGGKAIAAGLTFRPLARIARDTLEWARTRPPDHAWRAGISREREAELLAAWRKQS
jgi:2'-hydroxyisoflavone reductase